MARQKSNFSPHGASRAGDEYQDHWGIELLLEWLAAPELYTWVRFEMSEAGALDDVVARRATGGLVCRQIKHTVDPKDADFTASWEWLTKQNFGKSGPLPSVLQKLAVALDKIVEEDSIVEASLYTNRVATPELKISLRGTRIDIDRVDDAIKVLLEKQLGGELATRKFFQSFDFYFALPGYEEFERHLKHRFMHVLGGSELGWENLRAAVREWTIRRDRAGPQGRISIEEVRRAALWHMPKELSQEFEVPTDYVVPDVSERDAFVTAVLERGEQAIVVLAAGPGTGKSTHLSALAGLLASRGVPVLRHHYYMGARERPEERFLHLVVVEALMAQLQRRYPYLLGAEGFANPEPQRFQDWLNVAGCAASERGSVLVVIIDGLDHVWRESHSLEELDRLITVLLPAPTGVSVIFGMQPLTDDKIPARLLRHVPRASWRSLAPFSRAAIRDLLAANEDRLSRGGRLLSDQQLTEAAAAFHELTDGHALHLRYSLEAFIESGRSLLPWEIFTLPPCPGGNIEVYYDTLIMRLPETGLRLLQLFTIGTIPWPAADLPFIIGGATNRIDEIRMVLREIRHLLRDTGLGLQSFHASLPFYLRRRVEHAIYRPALLQQVCIWLRTRAPEPWRWAYLWRVEAEQGNLEPLIAGPDEAWLVQAVASHRPARLIDAILTEASWAALQSGDIAQATELGIRAEYAALSRATQLYPQQSLISCALACTTEDWLFHWTAADLENLSPLEMVALVEGQRHRDMVPSLAQSCLDTLRRRHSDSMDQHFLPHEEPNEISAAWPWLLAFSGSSLSPADIDCAKSEHPSKLFELATAMARAGRLAEMPALVQRAETASERHELALIGLRHALTEGVDVTGWNKAPLWCSAAPLLASILLTGVRPQTLADLALDTLEDNPADDHDGWTPGVARLHRVFLSSFCLELAAEGAYSDLALRKGHRSEILFARAGRRCARLRSSVAPMGLPWA